MWAQEDCAKTDLSLKYANKWYMEDVIRKHPP